MMFDVKINEQFNFSSEIVFFFKFANKNAYYTFLLHVRAFLNVLCVLKIKKKKPA